MNNCLSLFLFNGTVLLFFFLIIHLDLSRRRGLKSVNVYNRSQEIYNFGLAEINGIGANLHDEFA